MDLGGRRVYASWKTVMWDLTRETCLLPVAVGSSREFSTASLPSTQSASAEGDGNDLHIFLLTATFCSWWRQWDFIEVQESCAHLKLEQDGLRWSTTEHLNCTFKCLQRLATLWPKGKSGENTAAAVQPKQRLYTQHAGKNVYLCWKNRWGDHWRGCSVPRVPLHPDTCGLWEGKPTICEQTWDPYSAIPSKDKSICLLPA